MAGPQIGHYAPGEIEYLVEHDGVVLMELDDFNWDIDAGLEAGGEGLGHLHQTYIKRTKAPAGTWGVSRKALRRADKGQLFLDLLKGAAYILTEPVAAAASTYTTSEPIISILQVQEVTAGTIWKEGTDFTVNYTTNVITFVSTVPAGGVEVKYLSTTSHLAATNLIGNGGFESALTNIWEKVGASCVLSQDGTNKYVGSYGCKVDVSAQNDGLQYSPDIVVVPGNVYRLRCWIKGTSGDTFDAKWTDGGGTSTMTSTATLASANWQECNWTFTPDESKILAVQILNTKATPADFYVDEVYLGQNAPSVNPLDGQFLPFQFNVIARRVVDGVTVYKIKGCAIGSLGVKSGTAYVEAIKGPFLDIELEA